MNSRNSIAALAAAAALFASAARAADVHVGDPWIREAPPNAPALAGYMVLENTGASPVALVGVRAEGFAKAMVHETTEQNGIVKMVHRMKVPVAPGGAVRFAPGGYHLMLMKPARVPRAGERMAITLTFDDGDARRVEFEVRGAR